MATQKYDSTLIEKKRVADGTIEFVLEKPDGLTYRAGQFFDIFLEPTGPDAEKNTYAHGFSFVSAPYEPHIAAATRMRSTSTFKNALNQLPIGHPVQIEAVWGNFTLRKNTDKPLVFLIGGIGITPIRSMVAQATHEGSGHKMTLIYANRTPEQAAYVDEFRSRAKANPNFKFVETYTQSPSTDPAAETGRISPDMVKRHVPDVQAPVYYMSGPRDMVYAMRDMLDSMDIDEDHIRLEEFDGY